ncbi:2-succinyl-5-enolpyruvyl-6-hydroxy-3-cyclohexene-1-carboxylic-acid synthase [Mangrovibacterium diazotrophicum]|uniref:2-succinyl-5-enolpyruvyl-6-hydroxy-3-cyclohexene-1-carboxylate synthase n=1 Tax=Mangrovibacterium diazotrophicum TaxID=1261403 RepID=A0A419W8V6_9BACT|nr:2-succinyl-5-enolpyruvyl-6-hydroxy-3-cyclohexene-1-carboxylic-acid synthase [Mangrovibacterium diazotrophicum]RKD91903.1 2-succinyl-5-enolpyruvyl-6-hydroxy-3-cyclohexene-1-carboxylate synthase [Mangrovibacterium diazotrophicum]
MISTKKHIQQLASLLLAKGIDDIIISPGSRNGPMTHTFAGSGLFNSRNIVDERSAAYFAMGLAQAKQKPVAIVCSSGTATLNYAPAIAEAFYLNIPLIVLTADRPDYWIDQAESQCIRQEGIYRNFTKKEISLPLAESEKELWFAAREINACLNLAVSGTPAPVHINIPLEEPLHDLLDTPLPPVKVIEEEETISALSASAIQKLAGSFNQSPKVMILAGQQVPNPGLENLLAEIVEKTGAVVLKEHLSNLNDPQFCGSIDTVLAAMLEDVPEHFQPDLLISFGGQYVSKALKQFLRKNKASQHWHLSLSHEHFDTYQSLTKVIAMDAVDFFEALQPELQEKDKDYHQLWKTKEAKVNQLRDQYISETEWSDLTVFEQIRKAIPENSVVHLGNSSPVRYGLICEAVPNTQYFSNRGTAGIDGPMSTAVGFAHESEKLNTIILGDLSFFYDSNALWNNYVGSNFRVIVINNRGGNIFSLIKGPGESPAFQEHFFTENKFKAEGIAKTFGLDYFKAENTDELEDALADFYSSEQQGPALLEIFTDAEVNTKTFRGLFKFVKQ